jgi:hypothetical protein
MIAYVATTANEREYVVLVDGKVVAGPFPNAWAANKEREKLLKADRVAAGDKPAGRVAKP